MAEPRDELDAWLSEPIQPLLPPPGAFERIRRRARKRKMRRAALSTLAAAAAVAIAVTLPQVVTGRLLPRPAAAPPLRRGASTASRPPGPSPSATGGRATLRIPRDFRPASVTFVGTDTGWVLGYTRSASRCAAGAGGCAVIARTDSYGGSWRPVSGPAASAPRGDAGASQIRFLGTRDGWVFGPGLWATHNGGRTWQAIATGPQRVIALEAAGTRAFAVLARCAGPGPDYAADCTSFSVYSSPAGGDSWIPVRGAAVSAARGARGSAQLLLTSSQAYLLAPGRLLGGAISDHTWHVLAGTRSAQPPPCDPGLAQPDGQPSGAMLASNSSGLILLCLSPPTAGGAQQKVLYRSVDGGRTWRQVGVAPPTGTALSLAGSSARTLILATDAGIERSTNDGAAWQVAQPASGAFPRGGFSYVGMTFPLLGVAVPADRASHTLWFTHDGGVTWQPSRIP